MTIGFFTDTYHPSINGITFVVDILRKNLQSLGHRVVVIAPRPGMRSKHAPYIAGAEMIWVPAIDGFFDESLAGLFAPSRVTHQIERKNLDVVVIFSPAQVGLLGAYFAKKHNLPLVQQYSTDLVHYVQKYPAVMPGVFALMLASPFALKMRIDEVLRFTAEIVKSRSNESYTWRQDVVRRTLKTIHNNCDEIIAVSAKTGRLLEADGVTSPITVLPTGVDALPVDSRTVRRLRAKWGLEENDIAILYVGRLAKEKNLDMLMTAFLRVAARQPHAKLIFVGRFGYRESLENRAAASPYGAQIVFAGSFPRTKLGSVYAGGDIFAFPSVSDTQGLVINEAAHVGLPIVWCDPGVNAIARHGVSGILSQDNAASFGAALEELILDSKMREDYGLQAQKIARHYSEKRQTRQFEKKLLRAIARLS